MGIEMVPISRHWSWNFGKLTGASKIPTWVCLTVGHHWKTRFVVVGAVFDWRCWRFSVGVVGVPDNRLMPWTWGAWSKWEAIRRQTSDFFAYKKMWSCSTFLCQGRSFTWIMSWVQMMLHAQIFQYQQRPHPQKPRQFDSQENYFESSNWKVEFFLLLALLSKYVRIIWYFLRYQQWVLPTAAFHCFALHGLHGGSLMSSYCLKFESSCRAAEMKSFGESKLYHVVGLCHIVLQSPSRLKLLSVTQVW